MPPKRPYIPTHAELSLGTQMTSDVYAQMDAAKAAPADLGATGHAHTVQPYQARDRQPAFDLAADRAADDVDIILPLASPELSARRAQRLGDRILLATEKALQLERRSRVVERAGNLMLLHKSWPGVEQYSNPLRPTTLSERYATHRMDVMLRKSREGANRRSHYRRTDNGLPGYQSMLRHKKNYTYGGGWSLLGKLEASRLDFDRPPEPGPEPRLSRAELSHKAKLARTSEETRKRSMLRITPEFKAAKFDRLMNSQDMLARITVAGAQRQRAKAARLTRKYTGTG